MEESSHCKREVVGSTPAGGTRGWQNGYALGFQPNHKVSITLPRSNYIRNGMQMAGTFFIGDLHLGHEGMIRFVDKDGKKIRPFGSIQEHDEALIANINSLVKPEDRLYFLGDVVINRKHLPQIDRINGRKKLLYGNHDIFSYKDYAPYFDDMCAYRIYPKMSLIMSHIPVHPCQLEHRFKFNVHGHLHSNLVLGGKHPMTPDERYINICPEHTGMMPVSMDDIIERIGYDKHAIQYGR